MIKPIVNLPGHVADSTDPHGSTLTQSVAINAPTHQNPSGDLALAATGNIVLRAISIDDTTVTIENTVPGKVANLTVDGTVNGRDVAADGAVLDVAVLETDVAAKGDIFVATDDDVLTNLGVGTNGQVLQANSGEASGVKWADVIKTFPFNWPNPVTSPAPDEVPIGYFAENVEIIHLFAQVVTGTGTLDFQVYIRDRATSDTGVTSLKTSGDFQADVTGVEYDATDMDESITASLASPNVLVAKAVSQTGSPTLVRLFVAYKLV